MNSNQLLKLGGVFVVLLLLVLVFKGAYDNNIDKPDKTFGKNRLFKDFPVNDVSHVTLTAPKDVLHLDRGEKGWTVRERKGYPADLEKVGELLRSVYDLGIVQKVPVGESKFGRVGLLSPAGAEVPEGEEEDKTLATILTFQEGEDDIAELWVGKEYQKTENGQFGPMKTTVGRFVKRGDSLDVYVIDEKFDNAKPDPKQWLDKQFFKVSKVKTIERIPAEDPKAGWKLTRTDDKGDFSLVDAKEGEKLDTAKTGSMKNAFANPSFEDVLMEDDVKKPGAVTFKIETFEGFQYEVKLSEKNEANEYLLTVDVSADPPKKREAVEGESEEDKKTKDKEFEEEAKKRQDKLANEKSLSGHVYKVRGFVADSINKDRSDLMEEPKDEKAEASSPEGASIPGLNGGIPGVGN